MPFTSEPGYIKYTLHGMLGKTRNEKSVTYPFPYHQPYYRDNISSLFYLAEQGVI